MKVAWVCLVLSAQAVVAADQLRWGLKWQAPAACIDAATLTAKVHERLERSVFGMDADFRVDGRVTLLRGDKWKASMTVVSRSGEVVGTREVTTEGANCHQMDDRLVFIVATAIEERAVSEPSPMRPSDTPLVAAPPQRIRPTATPGAVYVEIETDDSDVTLFRHVGTSYGSVGGRAAVITTVEKICATPCEEVVENPKNDFFVGGPGVTASSAFSIDKHGAGVLLKVKPGNAALRTVGWVLAVTSAIAAVVGGAGSVINATQSSTSGIEGVQNPYGTGKPSSIIQGMAVPMLLGGLGGIGISIPLFVLTGTKVDASPLPAGDGSRQTSSPAEI